MLGLARANEKVTAHDSGDLGHTQPSELCTSLTLTVSDWGEVESTSNQNQSQSLSPKFTSAREAYVAGEARKCKK